MEHLNVTFGDSRDAYGRGRFFPLVPEKHFNAGLMDAQSKWFRSEKFYNFEEAYLVLFFKFTYSSITLARCLKLSTFHLVAFYFIKLLFFLNQNWMNYL